MSEKGKGKRKADNEAGEEKEKKTKKKKGEGKKKGTGIYIMINKKRYDRGMYEAAEAAPKLDGKIGMEDAKKILKEALDGHQYTTVEKNTMRYIRENYKFTDEADEHIRKAVASFAAKKAAKKKATGKGKGKGTKKGATKKGKEIGRAVQQECRDRSRMPSSA
eukprot:TRINITY_DN3055_c0_g1_i4.p1 TRINITY_DN3055_c0_g1~~TRINITY_DN3055_c0_g1_i4.p1  ORF type:complete len:163 (-),score=45.95 TRINITY_DN3055_c0_g1_i4:18-506(-)